MPLYLSENVVEQDYDPLFVINYKAFSSETIMLDRFPRGLEPSVRAEYVALFASMRGFGNVKAAKVVDDQTGQICAFATVRLFDGPPFASAGKSDVHFPHLEGDKRAFTEWITNTKNDRRRTLKALQVPGPYGYLSCLATDPSRQRQGAASLLMNWFVDLLDRLGARGGLQASPTAVQYGLYEKFGFRTVDVHTYADKDRFPDAEPVVLTITVRESRSS